MIIYDFSECYYKDINYTLVAVIMSIMFQDSSDNSLHAKCIVGDMSLARSYIATENLDSLPTEKIPMVL